MITKKSLYIPEKVPKSIKFIKNDVYKRNIENLVWNIEKVEKGCQKGDENWSKIDRFLMIW